MKRKEAEIDLDELCYCMQRSRWVLKRFREERREAVRDYVGFHWSEDGSEKEQPLNLLSQYVTIVGRALIAKNPRIMLSTFDSDNKPAVAAMQGWANNEIVRTRLADTFSRVVLDALFSIGICKVGLATPADSASGAWNLPAGSAFCERVDLDDFVFDAHARDFSEVDFIGHRYRAPLSVIRDSKLYSKARLTLTPSYDPFYNLEGDERISTLGRGLYAGQGTEFEEKVDLWEIYLPRHRLIVTLLDDAIGGAETTDPQPEPTRMKKRLGGALRVQKWLGPECGPYHILRYLLVPGNIMPKAPIQDLIALNDTINGLYRKLIDQAERQKTNLIYQRSAQEDAARQVAAKDGEAIATDNPTLTQTHEWGGPSQANLQFGVHLQEVYNKLAGNLEALGGLSPQSRTLGQDKMLDQSAMGTLASLQDTTTGFVSDTLRSMLWFWWKDPYKVMRSKHMLPGLPDMGITQTVTPEDRMRSRFEDLELEVDPYSMQHQTPQQVMAGLDQVMTQILVPLMPFLAQQGVKVDFPAYLKKKAAYMNLPDLPDIVTMGEVPQDGGQGGGMPGMPSGGKAPETTRNYVRRSIGQDTGPNKQSELMNSLSKNIRVQNGQQAGSQRR